MTGAVRVQVWWARLSGVRPGPAALTELLDPVERTRYEAISKPADRERFLAGCALSRIALSEPLGLPPAEIPLRRVCPRCGGPHGKPGLAAAPHADVGFSVTHSGDVVGVAVGRGVAVGLDAEERDAALDVATVAPVALTDRELTALNAHPATARAAAFLRTWTRKEAVLKALGVGLTVPLRRLEVSAPENPPTVLSWPEQLPAPPGLAIADTDVEGTAHPPAIAAVAVLGATAVRLDHRDGTDALSAYGAARGRIPPL
ncbi:4'-phosphopantetheinyl transferase family protein [Streptomyces sp. NPDC002328]|uniref:4'-phosphopantetheinyl transferase family protein n=1 Tax=Streptomyces sp. NPDC002328 TaxID=3364642 RepID=UPI0036B1505F